jgi:hypothetical protein
MLIDVLHQIWSYSHILQLDLQRLLHCIRGIHHLWDAVRNMIDCLDRQNASSLSLWICWFRWGLYRYQEWCSSWVFWLHRFFWVMKSYWVPFTFHIIFVSRGRCRILRYRIHFEEWYLRHIWGRGSHDDNHEGFWFFFMIRGVILVR